MSWAGLVDILEEHLLPCTIKQVTGMACPGCGMQSALIALLRGQVGESLAANPALLPLLFTVVYTALHLRFGFVTGARNVLIFFCATLSLMIANYLVRSGLFG